MSHEFERLSREILAKNGPVGISIAIWIVGADELPFGGAAEAVRFTTAAVVQSAAEGNASGDEGGAEVVPEERIEY